MTMIEGSLRQQLFRAARGGLLLRIVALAATFATSVVLARALGPAQFGVYAYVFALVTLLAFPAQVGVPTLLVRETARYQAQAQWSRLRGLWRWASRVILSTSLAAVIVALAYLAIRWQVLTHVVRATALAGVALVPLIALGNARGAALRGLRRVVAGQLPETVLRPVLLVAFVGGAWALHGRMSAASAMAWHVLAAVMAFSIGAMLLRSSTPAEARQSPVDLSEAPAWRKAVLPLALITGFQLAGNQSGILLIGWFRSVEEVGLYKVATSAATLTLFGLQTTALVITPHLARQHALGDAQRLQRLVSLAAVVGVLLTVPALIVFVAAGEWILQFLYGRVYVDAYKPLLILTAGQMVNTFFGLNAGLLSMTGHESDAARWLLVSAGITIIIGVAVIPAMGMVGAAISYVVALTVWNVAFWWIGRRKLGVDTSLISVMKDDFLSIVFRL